MQAARGASLSEKPPSPRSRLALLLSVAAAVIAADVVTKRLAVDRLSARGPVEAVDGVLTLRLVRNSGAAFGMAAGLTVVLTLVALVVVVVILRAASRLRSAGWAIALALVLGGAVGNLLDRIFRDPGPLRGQVVDFLELPHWPVFNLADSSIVAGAVLMVLLTLWGVQYDGRRVPAGRGDPEPVDPVDPVDSAESADPEPPKSL